jgi:hypothetical protein
MRGAEQLKQQPTDREAVMGMRGDRVTSLSAYEPPSRGQIVLRAALQAAKAWIIVGGIVWAVIQWLI